LTRAAAVAYNYDIAGGARVVRGLRAHPSNLGGSCRPRRRPIERGARNSERGVETRSHCSRSELRAPHSAFRTTQMTQLESARKGIVTPEMEFVAKREDLHPELVRAEVARGRMVIPANVVHLSKKLQPMCIGVAAKCKINANIGNSAVTGKVEDELEKLRTAVELGSDTVMDLSTGGKIDEIRQAIIDASPVPIGTVPAYQIIQNVKDPKDITPRMLLDMVEHQAKQGVDYMTIHAGVLLEYVALTSGRGASPTRTTRRSSRN
jgi:thiamine biosynthesis protein ThiC